MKTLVILLAAVVAFIPSYAGAGESVRLGDSGPLVIEVQTILSGYGYTVKIDGEFGKQTERAVLSWQKSNGLVQDAIVGPITLASLRKAVRLNNAQQVTPTLPPPPKPLNAPCSEFHGLLSQYDWNATRMAEIMYRESRCDPNAYNGRNRDRSYGLLQLNTKGALWGELSKRCGLTSQDQLFDPATNIACAYKLYQQYGMRPWRT